MTQYSDDFNRADNASLGANWTEVAGTGAEILSNALHCADSSDVRQDGRYESDTAGTDTFAQATVSTWATNTTVTAAVCTRFASAAQTFYTFEVIGDPANGTGLGAGTWYSIAKVVAGAYTRLTSGAGSLAAGDVIKIVCTGTTISGYKNGSQVITTTDGSITTGTRGGYKMGRANASDNVALDRFVAGDGTGSVSAMACKVGTADGARLALVPLD